MNLSDKKKPFRIGALSVVKHAYVPQGMLSHPRFEIAFVADDEDQPDWVHERNANFAAKWNVPYVRNVELAIQEHVVDVAVISSAAERHCDLSVRAAHAGLHVVQDKPMSTTLSECDRVIDAVDKNGVKFLMWNRNLLPSVQQTRELVHQGKIGDLRAIHVDFYFAKDAGPPVGSRPPHEPPQNWLEALIAAGKTGADGGIGHEPMGELEVEGIYPLGYISRLDNSRVRRVFARTTAHFHQLQADHGVDDLASVSLEMESGVRATLCIGRIGNASHPDIGEIKIRVLGSNGALVVHEGRPEIGLYYRRQPETEFPNIRLANDNDWLLADNLARALDEDGDTILNARTSRDICATIQAAIESGKTGQVVEVKHRND